MPAHSTLTGADLHILKGADSAVSGQIPVADGAGDTAFTTINNVNKVFITADIDDVSTAGSYWVVPGIAGDVTSIKTVLHGALGTADAGLSFEIAGTPITSGGITITQAGSAAGDVDSSTPSAANTITASQPIEIITDGASTNTVKVTVTFTIDVS